MNRVRRSELSTPGHSTKMIAKGAASDADLVFLDLEDAVAPSAKPGARKNIVAALDELETGAAASTPTGSTASTPSRARGSWHRSVSSAADPVAADAAAPVPAR